MLQDPEHTLDKSRDSIKETDTRATCFVAPLAENSCAGPLGRLYQEVYLPAIVDAGLRADTLAFDSPGNLLPTELLEKVAAAQAYFADVSLPEAGMWLTLGCAVTLKKQVCLVAAEPIPKECTSSHGKPRLPPSNTIFYPSYMPPSDFQKLRESITRHLLGSAPPSESTASPPIFEGTSVNHPNTPALEGFASFPATPAGRPDSESQLSVPSRTETKLKLYELIALSLIAQSTSTGGLTLKMLAQGMHKLGLVQATGLAINSLRRKQLVKRNDIMKTVDAMSNTLETVCVTPLGEEWLLRHPISAKEMSFARMPDEDSDDLIGLLASLRF